MDSSTNSHKRHEMMQRLFVPETETTSAPPTRLFSFLSKVSNRQFDPLSYKRLYWWICKSL